MSWFKKLFSSDTEASTKRFVCFLCVAVYIIQHFLLMYFKIEVANKDLVRNSQDGIYWLSLIFGGFIAAEKLLNNVKIGGPANVVQQDVKEQNVTVEKKDE